MKKTKAVLKKAVLLIIGVAAVYGGYIYYDAKINTITVTNTEPFNEVKPIKSNTSDNELKTIMSEADFLASQKLQARKILVARQKDKEIARNKEEMERLEAELSDIRSQELTLGKTTASFR